MTKCTTQAMTMLLTILAGPAVGAAAAGEGSRSVFHDMDAHYRAVWAALADDRLDGVATHAEAIEKAARGLAEEFDAARAGVAAEDAGVVRQALPEIREAASALAEAGDLAAAREALYALSKPLVRYRGAVSAPGNVVAYCPMAKKSWLQPDEAIANPYYGKSMLRCGKVVAR